VKVEFKEHHATHVGNFALFSILLALLIVPIASIGFVRYEENGGVLSSRDVYVEESDEVTLPAGKFVKVDVGELEADEEGSTEDDTENEVLNESTDSEEFDPANYPPANLVNPE
jgi:hypothetical protein